MRNWTIATLATIGLLLAGTAGTAHAEAYEVTVENLVPGGMETGQPLTPPLGVVHDAGYTLFAPGVMATPGLEVLAEEGNPMMLKAEADGNPNVSQTVVGDGPFLGSVSIMVEGDPGDLFSVVTMLARTNDLVTGVHDVVLPDSGSMMLMTNAYDAGTEENTGLVEHIPFYGNNFVGPDESNPLAEINSYTVVDDPDHGMINYSFPPTARVTISVSATPVESASWGAIKATWSD